MARWQLLEAGITARRIDRRLEDGRLAEIHRGVYLVGAVPSAHAYDMAALLAHRLKASLSHRSATHLWKLLPYPPTAPVWITIPPERSADGHGSKRSAPASMSGTSAAAAG